MERCLSEIRDDIDQVDHELARLLSRRATLALEAGACKRCEDKPLVDAERELAILKSVTRDNAGPLSDASLLSILREITQQCRRLVLDPERGQGTTRETPAPRVVAVGPVRFGEGQEFIAGPCAVESRESLFAVAAALRDAGVRVLRGGAYKPRSSPYAFQGAGEEGLRWLREVADELGMQVVSEVADTEQVALVARYADMVQVGARAMHNTALLTRLGSIGKPVLLKRGLCATLDEMVMAVEYLRVGGNEDIVLCERGIRTYENATRNTLDISAIPLLRSRTGLPVIADVSHAAGRKDILADLAAAALAAGAAGVMVEVHERPEVALSDGQQQITPTAFRALREEVLRRLA